MTALKGDAIERFLKSPDRSIILIYGPDHGRVVETAKKIRHKLGAKGDSFNEITLDAATLTNDPARLIDEAQTLSMFGDKRLIRVTAETANIAPALTLLLELDHNDSVTIIEAGDLKPTSPVRSLIEKSAHAVALPCYSETVADLSRRIDADCATAGMRITKAAKELLLSQLGADQALSNQEINKLLLMCHGTGDIDVKEVRDSLADASNLAIDDILDSAFSGQTEAALLELQKALQSDESPVRLQMSLTRHVQMLLQARIKIEKGGSAASAVEALRPPLHFMRKTSVERQLGRHTVRSLTDELEKLHQLSGDIRLNSALAEVFLERAVLRIALAAKRGLK